MFQPGPLLREACQAWKDQQAGFVAGRWLDEVSHQHVVAVLAKQYVDLSNGAVAC